MELTGKIKVIFDEQSFPSGFTKRAFVVTTEEQYPNDIQFELLKDKSQLINGYRVGERVKVSFDLRGKEYNGKYYNNLVAWRLDRAGAENQGGSDQMMPPPAPETFNAPMEDDLPF